MFDVRKAEIEVDCPGCGCKNKIKLNDSAKQKVIACKGCRETIKLIDDNKSLENGIREAEVALKKFSRNINQMFK